MRILRILEVRSLGTSLLTTVIVGRSLPIFSWFGILITEETRFLRSAGFWYHYPKMKIVKDCAARELEDAFNGKIVPR